MIAGTPDIKVFFETLDECVDCKFNDKFSRYADYLSIAKIEDTQIISGKPYIFSEDGTLKTGWRTVKGLRRYYSPETGEQISGWIDYADGKYFYSADGGKQTGPMSDDDGNRIFFDEYTRKITVNTMG